MPGSNRGHLTTLGDYLPQSWVCQQLLWSAGYWLVQPFPQPSAEAAFCIFFLLPCYSSCRFCFFPEVEPELAVSLGHLLFFL